MGKQLKAPLTDIKYVNEDNLERNWRKNYCKIRVRDRVN